MSVLSLLPSAADAAVPARAVGRAGGFPRLSASLGAEGAAGRVGGDAQTCDFSCKSGAKVVL